MESFTARREFEVSLGRLHINMLSLEMLLRLYLFYKEPTPDSHKFVFDSLKEGDIAPENYFTNTCTLRPLIDKYNSYCKIKFNELMIDPNLADIRNTLAHGRVLSQDSSFLKTQLFNFERDKEAKIIVTSATLLTKDWFTKQIKLFFNAMVNVQKRIKSEFHDVVGEITFE